MAVRRGRGIITVVMDILVVLAVVEAARLVVSFFGQVASQGWAAAIIALTDPITLGLGFAAIKTPYGGVFDVDAAATVVALVVLESVLSLVRSKA